MIDLLQSIAEPLARAYDATRIRTWPIGQRLEFEIFSGSSEIEHLNCFLDAAGTFHPSSRAAIWFENKILEGIQDSGFRMSAYMSLGKYEGSQPGFLHPDVAVLLHPYPFGAINPILSREFRKIKATHKWIYFRNFELWDGTPFSRAKRCALNIVRKPLEHLIDRIIEKRFERVVRPKLREAMNWAGDAPCEHRNAFRVLNKPRPIQFCPECGMGLTSPEAIPSAAKLAGIYGEHYALAYRYVGRREYARFQREQVTRINAYIEQLGHSCSPSPIFEFEPPDKNPTVLDFGCGGGLYAPLWLDRGWRYLGVDFASGAIENARRNNPGAKFAVGGLDAPEVAAGAPYDVIYLSHVLEHVPEPGKLLKELRERTANGGWIYLEVPNGLRATWDMKHRGFANREHLWDFTPNALKAIVESAGWRDVRVIEDESETYPVLSLIGRNDKM